MENTEDIKEVVCFNTPDEPIRLTGLPLNEIPPDTPNFLTDRTYFDILDGVACGVPVTKILGNMGCEQKITGRIIRWIYKDDSRKEEYLRARAIGSEILADEMIEIADGRMDADNPIPEDIARSKLKIDTRRFLIGVNNKERFADVPKVEVNINLLDAMKAADARLTIDAETIE